MIFIFNYNSMSRSYGLQILSAESFLHRKVPPMYPYPETWSAHQKIHSVPKCFPLLSHSYETALRQCVADFPVLLHVCIHSDFHLSPVPEVVSYSRSQIHRQIPESYPAPAAKDNCCFFLIQLIRFCNAFYFHIAFNL